ncbi:pyocin knob domain-containing protein [Levilactobacillus brevis]|uniref:pyocin knob domain-containing protein n=1 Tax=Levilactobacillus brevis TaxID=1580 RepID=UPI00069C4E49|nr:pyocin knob domain-containing protein [Levilactobacillus brevis]
MATPNVGILTTAGKALIDKVNSGQAKISFSKIVFSSMDNSQLSDMQVKALTAIAPQEVVVSSPETTLDTNSGETRIRATGTNEKLADGVYVKTYGVFAKDDTGSEILYGVTVSPNPNYFPAYDGVTPQAVTYSYKTVIQETSNITMTNSNDVYASQEDLTEALQPYIKTVDVNQQLDKKVNIADMRKPASDVAGIEEVNAKQDKIGYTPADDSKVLHSTVTPLNSTDMNTVLTAGFYQLFNGTNGIPNGDNWTLYQVIPLGSSNSTNGIQLAYETNNTVLGIRSWDTWGSGTHFSNWVQFADDSKVVHSSDMRKPASDVAGIEEVNAKQDKIGYTPADDSKVAHLSGTNNFDTVPTVKNNPLLLASSLPSDLARTTKDANFTGKLQKSGIDVATKSDVTTAVSTATANMVDSSKPTNFTAGLQSGGVDVATAADLKSIEDSAWRQLDNKYITVRSGKLSSNTNIIYKIDQITKRIYLSGFVIASEGAAVTVNLSHIIKASTSTGNGITYYNGDSNSFGVSGLDTGNTFTIDTTDDDYCLIGFRIGGNSDPAYFEYTELV